MNKKTFENFKNNEKINAIDNIIEKIKSGDDDLSTKISAMSIVYGPENLCEASSAYMQIKSMFAQENVLKDTNVEKTQNFESFFNEKFLQKFIEFFIPKQSNLMKKKTSNKLTFSSRTDELAKNVFKEVKKESLNIKKGIVMNKTELTQMVETPCVVTEIATTDFNKESFGALGNLTFAIKK